VDQIQRVPGGACSVRHHPANLRATPPERVPTSYSSISHLGHVFEAELPLEPGLSADLGWEEFMREPTQRLFLNFHWVIDLARNTLVRANYFFELDGVEPPAYVQISLGILDALNYRMYDDRNLREDLQKAGEPFLDQDFRAEITVQYAQLGGDGNEAFAPLLAELEYGFDRPTAPTR
jgi:hypothetical protein